MTKRVVTIRDIAREIGVSEATVSLALNGNPAVKAETRQKVKDTAAALGYVPNTNARRLVLKRSGVVGIVVPEIENIYYAVLVRELSERMADGGYSLSIFISSNDPEKEYRAVSDMIAARVEGIIYVPVNTALSDQRTKNLLLGSGIPTVCMSTVTEGMNCVLCDLEGGMKTLVSYLLEKQPSSILYLGGPQGMYTLDCRRQAFLDALQQKHVQSDVRALPSVNYTCAQEAARTILSDLPDIIVCANDFMALGVVNLFAERGISVPNDVMVTGFDDSIFSVTSPVPLTTVRQDLHTMAIRTAELLLHMIDDPNVREDVRIPTELIIRKSTKKKEIDA